MALTLALATALAIACGDGDGPTGNGSIRDVTGVYAVTIMMTVEGQTASCPATVEITSQSGSSFSGTYDIPASANCTSDAGTFAGTIDANGRISIPGLFADVLGVEDEPGCDLLGNTTFNGTASETSFTMQATGTVRCDFGGEVITADVTVVLTGTKASGLNMIGTYDITVAATVEGESFTCTGTVQITTHSGSTVSGNYSVNPSTDCSAASGTFSGTIDGSGNMSVPGLLGEILDLDAIPECGLLSEPAMTGTGSQSGFTLQASSTVRCTFDGTAVDLSVSVVVTGTRT
jgi:hypothetical protein